MSHKRAHKINCLPTVANDKTANPPNISIDDLSFEKTTSHYKCLFQNNHIVMLLIDPQDGTIIDANPAACSYYGWSKDKLMHMKIFDINTLEAEKVCLEMQRASRKERNHFFFRHRRADGSIRQVEVYSAPIHIRGKVLIYSTIFDITPRRQTEAALRLSEARYRTLFEKAPVGIFQTTFKGKVLYVNPHMARMVGARSTQEAIERFTELSSQLYANPSRRAEMLRLLEERGEIFGFEYEAIALDGQKKWFSMDARISDQCSNDSFIIEGFTSDITEKKHLEKQLSQAQKLESVGRLAGGVAHDFNNMLEIITGHVELALNQCETDQAIYHHLKQIRMATDRSTDLTRQLLAFASQQTVKPAVLDLNKTLPDMLKMLRRIIGEEISLIWIPDDHLWLIKIDPSQIDQILANIVINAKDAINGFGQITIQTSNVLLNAEFCVERPACEPGDYVLLSVSDTGMGMNKDVLDHIFEPFFTTKEMGQGTGLGLATTYGIVVQNKGFIEVRSKPGQGSSFDIYFPREKNELPAEIEAKASIRPLEGKETVLIVEDEVSILSLCKTILSQQGYTVIAANTPDSAIREAESYSGKIDLLITDVVMPQMNGQQLAQRLSAVQEGIKCLFMSGYTANVIAHRDVLTEGINFIQKPFTLKALTEKVREVLELPPPPGARANK